MFNDICKGLPRNSHRWIEDQRKQNELYFILKTHFEISNSLSIYRSIISLLSFPVVHYCLCLFLTQFCNFCLMSCCHSLLLFLIAVLQSSLAVTSVSLVISQATLSILHSDVGWCLIVLFLLDHSSVLSVDLACP